MDNISDIFIHNILDISRQKFYEKDFLKIRELFLDYIGVTLGGDKFNEEKIHSLLKELPETGNSPILGQDLLTDPSASALVNGMNAHVLELDDGNRIGMLHIGALVFSALLSISLKEKLDSNSFFKAALIGYEATIRLAMAIQPDAKLKGLHATGVCGTVGASLAVAFALDYSFEQIKSTLAAACTSASGLLEMIVGESELKIFNAGNAAMEAVVSALIGKINFKSPRDPIGGKRGFLNLFSNNPKLNHLMDFGNSELKIHSVYLKPYAACRHCHPSIEAAINLRKNKNFGLDNIDKIKVSTYNLAINGHDHKKIDGVASAKMSIPYSLGVALLTGKAGLNEFTTEYINIPQLQEIIEKVEISENPEFTALCPSQRIAEVEIVSNSGISYSFKTVYPKGEPENPLAREELTSKFKGLAQYAGLKQNNIDNILELVLNKNFDIKEIVDLCRP